MNDDQAPPPIASPQEPTTGSHLVPQNTLPTAGQRWYPNPAQIVALSALVGGLLSLVDVLSADVVTFKVAVLAFCKGGLMQLAVYMGMRSAGPVVSPRK